MRRRSDRGKAKSAPKEQSPDKPTRKSSRHSRRRKKSTSSSDSDSSPRKADKDVSEPLEIQVQDIELPNEAPVPPSGEEKNVNHNPEEAKKEWKEDTAFWESETKKPTEDNAAEGSSKDKEESSLWKVQSANGAGGEIQKLKICRQKPTESPEIGETSLRKRLSRGIKDSRSTDESTQDESEKEPRKSRHRTRTSSRNSPLVSPTVKCDQESPTKIKIINVSNLAVEEKVESVTEKVDSELPSDKEEKLKPEQVQEDSQVSDTLDIALPAEESSLEKNEVDKAETTEENIVLPDEKVEERGEKIKVPTTEKENESKKEVNEQKVIKNVMEDNESLETEKEGPSAKESSPPKESSDEKKEVSKSPFSRASSDNSDGEEGASASKRRTGPQSFVQRKRSPKQESSDSEEGEVKKKEDHGRESSDTQDTRKIANDKEIEAESSHHTKENNLEENIAKEEPIPRPPMPRKRRWGSSKANRPEKKQVLSISTDSLKNLIPDAKPVPADELQLSVEEEEGQLDDDDEEDDVIALVAKDEEKQLREERERQREERQRERERELEERRKRKEQERLERKQQEQLLPPETVEKGSSGRKIHLLTDDNRKLARAPSPPRRKPTSVLYITHLVRPFTVQQLKNLLLRTGTIAENGFWIDKIKSKCYVEYATEDQAIETRHALHGVRWPTSNPKTLVVEFACHDDLVMAQTLSEEPEVPRKAEPLTMVEGWLAEQNRMKDRTHRTVREWDVGKPEHPDEVLEYDQKLKEKKEQERKSRKERHHRSPTTEDEHPTRKARKKEEDAPAKLLDDLFRKTKNSPCIYWLPLTQEQIAVKEEIRRQHMAEHERRMAELKKAELARRERERRSRK